MANAIGATIRTHTTFSTKLDITDVNTHSDKKAQATLLDALANFVDKKAGTPESTNSSESIIMPPNIPSTLKFIEPSAWEGLISLDNNKITQAA
jgi:hypothetical protein